VQLTTENSELEKQIVAMRETQQEFIAEVCILLRHLMSEADCMGLDFFYFDVELFHFDVKLFHCIKLDLFLMLVTSMKLVHCNCSSNSSSHSHSCC